MKSVKTKIRNTCKKYCHVKVLYKQKKIISSLSNKEHLVILKQGKGRCVLIMGQNNCSEKCISLLLYYHLINLYVLQMALQNRWSQKYSRHVKK